MTSVSDYNDLITISLSENACVYFFKALNAGLMLNECNSDALMQQLKFDNCLTLKCGIFTLASAGLPKLNRGMNLKGAVCLTKFCMEQKT